jgi:magnesium chelatase accessory protein
MVLDGGSTPQALVSLNGAMLPMPGWSGVVFPPAAKLLAATPLAARLFAWRAGDPAAVRRLVASTGSVLDPVGLDLYGRLIRSPDHVHGTLQMMAGWDLAPLQRDLPRLDLPVLLVVGLADGTVDPRHAERVRQLLPRAHVVRLAGLGHLAHEERPGSVADALGNFAATLA